MARSEPSKGRRRGVPLPFGKHRGELVERAVLLHPEYIYWLDAKERLAAFASLYEHIDWCLATFDRKPFVGARCATAGCQRPVTRYSLDRSSPEAAFWCAECEPRGEDGSPESVSVHATLLGGLRLLAAAWPDYTRPHRRMMKALLVAKGFDGARTPSRVLAFFHGE